jgi:hypothetical protein
VRLTIESIDEKQVCRVVVMPAPWPAWAEEGKKAGDDQAFYLRTSNATIRLPPADAASYIHSRWPHL